MTTLPSGLPVVVDRDGRQPLAIQISAQLQTAVTSGALRAGDRLPSSRDLAATLSVSRTVVTNAYARLFAEGWLEGRHGSGTYVADVSPPPARAEPARTTAPSSSREPDRPPGAAHGRGSAVTAVPNGTRDPGQRPGGARDRGSAATAVPNSARDPGWYPGAAHGRGSAVTAVPNGARDPGQRPGGARDRGSAVTAVPNGARDPGWYPGGARGRGSAGTDALTGPERPVVSPGRPVISASGGRMPPPNMIDLQPGICWADGVDPASWRRAWRQAGAHLPSRWPDPYGLPELREEIAAYLRRSRGLAVTPAHVLVTQGVSSGLTLLADALLAPGDKAGMEEPGYPTGREVLRRAGAQVVPCRVDAHGILPEALPGDLRLLYTTPAHQYPLGGRLPVSRRQALVAWARATGALVVEDDYDSEFRYDVGPLPALHSMDPDAIVYLGTASKVLATAFGAGWLIAPPALVDQLAELRPRLGVRIPEPVQHAILALLRSGDLERHVRKMRLEYARRRTALVTALTQPDTQFRLLGDTAGMHVVLELPGDYPTARLIAAAAARGVVVYSLTRYFAGPPTMNGLILGYGTATLPQVRKAATVLADLLTRRAQT